MRRLQAVLLLASWLLPLVASAQDSTVSGLVALLSAGRYAKTPVGLVCDDRKTLQDVMVVYHDGMTIDEVTAKLPRYSSVTRDSVAIVAPDSMPAQTARLLGTIISSYMTGPASFAQMGTSLWMDVVIATSPHKPQTFLGVISGRDPAVVNHGINLQDASVETILNAIVRSSAGAAWIVLPPSKGLEDASQDDLWNFVRYGSADVDAPISSLCCISLSLLQH